VCSLSRDLSLALCVCVCVCVCVCMCVCVSLFRKRASPLILVSEPVALKTSVTYRIEVQYGSTSRAQ
jgi:Flp pilus assembly protein protease CpaA